MTVLVGVLCSDGVVLGSDSSATFSASAIPTIEQPVKKTFVIGDDMIFAGTGAVGLGQRVAHVLTQLRNSPNFDKADRFAIAKTISAHVLNDFQQTLLKPGGLGALVAFSCTDGLHLCEFQLKDFQPEFKSDDLWFSSMGSGQLITDPFLGLLRRVFFRGGRPTLNEGIFAVTWTLQHAIELNAGGINGPPQIAVLSVDSSAKKSSARLLTDAELAEHINNVTAAELHLGQYRETFNGTLPQTTEPPPEAPPPPENDVAGNAGEDCSGSSPE